VIARRLVSGLAATLLTLACTPGPAKHSEAIVRGMVEAINDRDFAALDTLVAANVQRHSGATPGVTVENLEQFKAFLHQDLAAVPDARQDIEFLFSEGDMVAGRFTYSGTQDGPMGPFPPSHRRLEVPFIGILRIEDGKIAEIWVEWDNLNGLTQLGHFPPPGASGSAAP